MWREKRRWLRRDEGEGTRKGVTAQVRQMEGKTSLFVLVIVVREKRICVSGPPQTKHRYAVVFISIIVEPTFCCPRAGFNVPECLDF